MKLLDYDVKFKEAPLTSCTCVFICTVTSALNSLQPLCVRLLILPVPAISFISPYFLQSKNHILCKQRKPRSGQMWLLRQSVNKRSTALYSRHYRRCSSLLTYIIWFSRTQDYWMRNTDPMSLVACTCGRCNRTQVRWVHTYKAILETTSAYTNLTEFAVTPPIFSAVIFQTSTKGYFDRFGLAHD